MVNLQDIQKLAITKKVPVLKVGNTVKVHQKIKEGNKERVQTFEGLIIKLNSGHAADKTFTVRKIVSGVGVEKLFPLYSPLIEIEVVKKAKVRRAKLYYMRDRSGKSARLKETFVQNQEMEDGPEEKKEEVEEKEVVAEAPVEAAETSEAAPEEPKKEEPAKEEAPKAEKSEEKAE